MTKHTLICCIVSHDKGSRALRIAKKHKVKGGTIFMGKGTIKNKILELLDLNDSRKEIVIMGADAEIAASAVEKIVKELAFHKPGNGIAFIVPLDHVFGCRNWNQEFNKVDTHTEDSYMYNSIVTIVDRGLADDVIQAANSAGARGGTIIHARGSGMHETEVLFAMPIEPEKEIVLIIAEDKQTEPITTAIRQAIDIDAPGKGIMMVSGIEKVYGLY